MEYYLVSIILKVNNITTIYNHIITHSTSKNLLQCHSTDYPSDRKSSFRCRSERVKLDVPDNELHILHVTNKYLTIDILNNTQQ